MNAKENTKKEECTHELRICGICVDCKDDNGAMESFNKARAIALAKIAAVKTNQDGTI